jgi:hypothetical protein
MIILDLCGGTGSWSKPYKDAGYEIINVDTLYGRDVRTFEPPKNVHGVLAAPPCTEFAVSGARWWAEKPPELLEEAIDIVRACLNIINIASPKWWALENPVGRLPRMVPELGKWKYIFQPYEYGDPWTKRTCLWGEFILPEKTPVEPIKYCAQGSWTQRLGGKSEKTKRLRSMTPPGFAKAFFKANR